MGLFTKNKKHNNSASPSTNSPKSGKSGSGGPDSPGSPLHYSHQDLRTADTSTNISDGITKKQNFVLPNVKRASGFFDLNLASDSPASDIFHNPPPPAPPLTHDPDSGPSYMAQAAMKNQSQSQSTLASSFYSSIPQMPNSRRVSQQEPNHPALLLKPPMLSSHNRNTSEENTGAFDGFDGVFIANSPTVAPSLAFDDADAPFSEQGNSKQLLPTLALANNYKITNDVNDQNFSPLNANTMEYSHSDPISESVSEPSHGLSVSVASDTAVSYEAEILSPASSNYSVSNVIEESPVEASSTPFSFQNTAPNQIEPRESSMRSRQIPAPIPIQHSLDPNRSPLGSPSAAAAAMASASLKSQLKIGTVRVVESQQANVEMSNSTFYAGEEGFSREYHSAESSQLNSDDENSHVQTYTANRPSGVPPNMTHITRVNSGSDSSYVNIGGPSTDAESVSSGAVVEHTSSNVPTPTDSSHPSLPHPYRAAYDFDEGENSKELEPYEPSNRTSTFDPRQNNLKFEHQRYDSEASHYSTTSTFRSEAGEFDEFDNLRLYHPQPHRPNSMSASKKNSKLRASIISTASSDILDSSGGIPNVDVLSITEKSSVSHGFSEESEQSSVDVEGREQALKDTQAQLLEGSSNPYRQSAPMLQGRPSEGKVLSAYMPQLSDYRQSHMQPPQDHNGVFYPAPIPVELRLPPLLSKKNQMRAKKGRPMSRRPGSFMRPGSMAIPPPPVWNVENGVTPSDRRSMLSRRLSNASTLNAFASRKSGEFDENANSEFDINKNNELDHDSERSNAVDGTTPDTASSFSKHEHEHEEDFEPTEDNRSSVVSGKGKGVSEHLQVGDEPGARISTMSTMSGEGKIGQLRDESWGQPSIARPFSQSTFGGEIYEGGEEFDDYSTDDGIQSDCATIQSDEEYQEDVFVDEEETKKLAAEAAAEDLGMIKNGNIDDFAFTSFNPNSAITDRGLLAGSIAYSSSMVPAVGVQPTSLIEELEMRKAGRKARLQRTYYDTNTGNAIAAEAFGKRDPSADQLLREPNSGHPLDSRHSKSLLELQHIANQDYEDQKNFRYGIHAAVESDRISRMGFSSTNLLSPNLAQQGMIEEGDLNESLGARRARLKKKRQEEAEAAAAMVTEEQDQTETLAQRRARLKKEKQASKLQQEQLAVGASDAQSFTSTQMSAIAT